VGDRISPGEKRAVGRQGERNRSVAFLEDNTALAQFVDVGRNVVLVAVETDHVCPGRIQGDKKNIQVAGGRVAASFRVIDVLKNHRDLKTSNVTFLDDHGRQLAQILAEAVAKKVDELDEKILGE